jgi:hypothetical protein
MKAIATLIVLAGFAAVASAQVTPANGDIIFTSETANGVKLISGAAPGGATTLYLSSNTATRFAGIRQAPDGNYYVADGRFPFPNTTDAGIVRISNIFSGSATASQLTQGNPIQNPLGLEWSNTTNEFITNSNPGSVVTSQTNDGIFGANLAGTVRQFYQEPFPVPGPRPAFEASFDLVPDPRPGSRDYLITTVNGGVDVNPNPIFGFDGIASAVWRLRYDAVGNTYNLDTSAPVVDFSASFTGASSGFFNTRGITAVPGTNSFFVADLEAGVINQVTMNAAGAFVSQQTIITGLLAPESVEYNPYTNKLVIAERGGAFSTVDARISDINLDGSGYRVLYAGEHARGFAIVPSPASAALLGVGGLVALRRRRK